MGRSGICTVVHCSIYDAAVQRKMTARQGEEMGSKDAFETESNGRNAIHSGRKDGAGDRRRTRNRKSDCETIGRRRSQVMVNDLDETMLLESEAVLGHRTA